MLHILLLVLKIIGIILAVILGILILLILVLLFVPVRYEVQGRCEGTLDSLKGKICVTWLLHFVRADMLYKNGRIKWRLRIAWLKKGNASSGGKRVDKDEHVPVKEIIENNEEIDEEQQLLEELQREVERQKEESENEKKKPENFKTEGDKENLDTPQKIYKKSTSDQKIKERKPEMEVPEKEKSMAGKKAGRFYQKILSWLQKIKCTFRKMCDKIKSLLMKKEKIELFLQDEVHKGAYQKCKKELLRLLRHLKPKKVNVKMVYGFDDPYYTGQVLAFLSMLYPFIGNSTTIVPDFENQILKGSVYLKGKIYLCHFVQPCWNLFWCKNVRQTYHDIRNFKL